MMDTYAQKITQIIEEHIGAILTKDSSTPELMRTLQEVALSCFRTGEQKAQRECQTVLSNSAQMLTSAQKEATKLRKQLILLKEEMLHHETGAVGTQTQVNYLKSRNAEMRKLLEEALEALCMTVNRGTEEDLIIDKIGDLFRRYKKEE